MTPGWAPAVTALSRWTYRAGSSPASLACRHALGRTGTPEPACQPLDARSEGSGVAGIAYDERAGGFQVAWIKAWATDAHDRAQRSARDRLVGGVQSCSERSTKRVVGDLSGQVPEPGLAAVTLAVDGRQHKIAGPVRLGSGEGDSCERPARRHLV
jgi:hypothetical protein